MSDGEVTYDSNDGVATITIRRPAKKNAINSRVASALAEAWHTFDRGADVVAVIAGDGGNFTAGIDINDPPANPYWAPNLGISTDKPIVAAIEGWCIGAGMMILQQVDLAIASTSAKFRYPEARIGLSRGLAAGIATKIPYKIAMEVLLLGEVQTPESFYRAGLINRVVEEGATLTAAHDWARQIASADSHAVQYIKRGVLDIIPRGAGEEAAHTQWVADQLPGNARLSKGEISIDALKAV